METSANAIYQLAAINSLVVAITKGERPPDATALSLLPSMWVTFRVADP
jgi:hypothetical protein